MTIDFGEALRQARRTDPMTMPEILAGVAAELGGTDLVVYLVDFGQTTLQPLPDRSTHSARPEPETVLGTLAGRAFTSQEVVTTERGNGVRVWVPLLEGSDRTGVVAVTLPSADESLLRGCEELGLLAGYLIAAQARGTDMYNLHRRVRPLSLAASLQWDLLPPLVLDTGVAAVAGTVEPAYDVGGDCFDYAANGSVLDFALMDAMGHGVRSALISSLAMGCYRHERREAGSLSAIHDALSSTIAAHHSDFSFVTGVLGQLNVETGELTFTNAGHPLPLLVRGGQVIGELHCHPTAPWGVPGGREPTVASDSLEPGDVVLLYTDGVIEARTPDTGEEFGIERLVDLVERNASELMSPGVIARRLVESVCRYRSDELTDDATVVLVRWEGPGRR